jgi:hypothetical protein
VAEETVALRANIAELEKKIEQLQAKLKRLKERAKPKQVDPGQQGLIQKNLQLQNANGFLERAVTDLMAQVRELGGKPRLRIMQGIEAPMTMTEEVASIEKEEVWKDIPGYDKRYQVSNQGNVRRRRADGSYRLMKGVRPTTSRRLWVTLTKDGIQKNLSAASLMAMAFIRMPKMGERLGFLDGDCRNHDLSNLTWVGPNKTAYKLKRPA